MKHFKNLIYIFIAVTIMGCASGAKDIMDCFGQKVTSEECEK